MRILKELSNKVDSGLSVISTLDCHRASQSYLIIFTQSNLTLISSISKAKIVLEAEHLELFSELSMEVNPVQ